MDTFAFTRKKKFKPMFADTQIVLTHAAGEDTNSPADFNHLVPLVFII